MRLSFVVFALTVSFYQVVFSQCTVTGSIAPGNVVCGDCAVLTAFGRGQGNQVFKDDFNIGAFSAGWGSTQQALFNNPCSANGVDGTKHVWMGNSSPVPRIIRTVSYNLTPATAGVTVCFDLLFAEQTGDPATAPCEGPDEPDEGVYLQYSTNNGTSWNTIHYFNPNGGSDPQLINWNNWCFQLPPAAITTQTQIRFFQDFDSGADYDHWGIDNFVIYYNDPSYQIIWQHDNYSYGTGNSGGDNPNPVCPNTNTSYYVTMSNGLFTCRDTVSITVVNPVIVVNAGNDTTICAGQCATLHGTAKVVKRPAKTPTYRNGEVTPIATVLGSSSSININIVDLNMSTVLANSITQVCLENLTFFGVNFFPPGQVTIGDFNIYLVCPDGTKVRLIPSGVTTSNNPLQGYTNTCFTPAATANIGSAAPPYTGTFASNQPFNNLVGCTANGVWAIEVTPASALGFGTGFFYGWSISFNDPEISYPAVFSWSPTTNMSNSTTLNPTVCPPATQTYTLFAQDTAGCAFASDAVNVNVTQSCCNIAITATSTAPSCTIANGSINLTVISGSGNYSYSWSNNQTTQDISGLGAGTYFVRVTDITQNCSHDTTITLTAPNSPVISSVNVTHETCLGDDDGAATPNASGGTGTLSYSWSTSQSGQTVNNLPSGNHSVTVTDANLCTDVESFTINSGPICCVLQLAATTTQPSCGLSDGGVDITVTGSGNYSYSWNNNAVSEDLSGVPAGNYSVTVTDLTQNCNHDTTVNLSNPNAPTITSITSTAETCADSSDGTATVIASGGTGTLSILWSNNDTTATITGLVPANYSVTVTDANSCQTSSSVNVQTGPICCALASTVTTVDASCSANDGSLTVNVNAASGTAPFSYSIDGINFAAGNVFSNLAAGSYDAIVRDVNSCADTNTVTITEANNTITTSISSNNITCFDDNNGMASVTASGGNAPLSILWSTNSTINTIINLAPGIYYVTVTDQLNCQRVDSAHITEPAQVTVELDDMDFCIGGNAILDAGLFTSYLWSTNDTVQTITAAQTGAYSVTVWDATGCSATDAVNVTVNSLPLVDAGLDSTIYDFETIVLSPTVGSPVNGAGFSWAPDTALSCTACQNPVASPDSSILYTLTYTDLNGCTDTSSVFITVLDGDFFAIVPNAFSPNGDGNNEILYVYHKGVSRLVFRVYNRWGSMIFETRELNEGWDGTFKGTLLDPSVFVYELYAEYFNFKAERKTGSVTLMR